MSEAAEVVEDLIVDGLNVTERVAEIEDQGYTLVPDFITPEEVARLRHAVDTEVHITEMRAIGTKTGKTWRAHNLLAKTRAVDYLFLDARIRALIEGVLGKFMSHNVAYLRPQEIQLLAVPREVVRKLPEKLQRLLGYPRFGLGVDGRDPIDVLKDGIVVHPTARLATEHRN